MLKRFRVVRTSVKTVTGSSFKIITSSIPLKNQDPHGFVTQQPSMHAMTLKDSLFDTLITFL